MNKKPRVYGNRMPKRQPKPRVIFKPKPDIPFPDEPHNYVWFALTVMSQHEQDAADALHERGHVVFNPFERVQVRACRRMRFRRREQKYPILTSYILLGVPFKIRCVKEVFRRIVEVPWRSVLAVPDVIGVVGSGGGPVPIRINEVERLAKQSGRDGVTRSWSPQLGESTLVVGGMWANIEGKVVEFKDGKVHVKLEYEGEGVMGNVKNPTVVVEEMDLSAPEWV